MGWLWVNIFRIIFHYLGLLNRQSFKNIDDFYTRKYLRGLVMKKRAKEQKWRKY